MSTYKHRQPIFSWSSVVLLSTLLLSPLTAASLLHMLARALPQAFAPNNDDFTAPACEKVAEADSPTVPPAAPVHAIVSAARARVTVADFGIAVCLPASTPRVGALGAASFRLLPPRAPPV